MILIQYREYLICHMFILSNMVFLRQEYICYSFFRIVVITNLALFVRVDLIVFITSKDLRYGTSLKNDSLLQ